MRCGGWRSADQAWAEAKARGRGGRWLARKPRPIGKPKDEVQDMLDIMERRSHVVTGAHSLVS